MASTKTISIFYDAGKPTYIYLKLKPTAVPKAKTKAHSTRTETKRDGRPGNSAHISEGMKRWWRNRRREGK